LPLAARCAFGAAGYAIEALRELLTAFRFQD
jgi:hypothetical protein